MCTNLSYRKSIDKVFKKPSKLNKMIEIVEKLSVEVKHVIVDLYLVNDNIYFGELTFYHDGGYAKFSSESLALKIRNWVNIE